eukprot:CAMPEP_0172927596 /NCGR_PEP_ID=MMETSP1075-20121228/217545_1 /TAXON_ID=2916 /ORGANISM="Ceratium fusus, Strain PA161109" /LENGTH=234 /DNA_ID=CAMNT_0013788857 /DNA_START=73 /DNA_END=773 /DNA_ORIENTATION=-
MAVPNTNIFIGDLPMEMDDDMLKQVFSEYGTVTWSRVLDSGGKPNKAAIVEFADIEEAKWCVENLDGNIPQGLSTPIKVMFKRSRSNDGGGKGYGGGGKFGSSGFPSYGKASGGAASLAAAASLHMERLWMAVPNTNIFIADLPMEVDDNMLKQVFSEYGTVTWSRVFDSGGKPNKAAIVEFADIEEAKWCVENLDGNIPQGLSTPIKVMFKRSRSNDGVGKGYGGGGKFGNSG